DPPIGDDVIDEIGRHGARVPEVVDLNRRWAARQDPGAGFLGEPFEVDGDIDVQLADQPRDVVIARAAHLDELVESGLETLAHWLSMLAAEGYGGGRKASTIMGLE